MQASASDSEGSEWSYWRASATLTLASVRDMFSRRSVPVNLGAGVTVALVALPLNLALALACGLPPSVGLLTGAIAGIVGCCLGASRFQVTGPEVALAPITLEIVSRHGFQGLLAATFLAGVMQVALGLVRVGGLVNAIPVPVIGGFLAAVGLLVFDSQLPRFLGLPSDIRLLSSVEDINALRGVDPRAVLVGLFVIATLVLLPRFVSRRVPAHLVGVAVAVISVAWFGVRLPTVDAIEGAEVRLGLPSLAGLDLRALVPEAIALALLASIDSLLCAVAVDARTGAEKTRSDQELVAQGLANVCSACVGGMPVAAAVVRSMAAVEAGATTRLAPLVQSLVLGIVLLAAASLVAFIPIVALAAILLVIGFRLIDFRQLGQLFRLSRFEAAIFVTTAVGIVVTDFVTGVVTGTVAALAHFARQQRRTLRHRAVEKRVRIIVDDDVTDDEGGPTSVGPRSRVVHLEGPLFFGSQDKIDDTLASLVHDHTLLLDLSSVTSVDVSGATALSASLERLSDRGVHVQIVRHSADRTLRWMLGRSARAPIVEPEAGSHGGSEAVTHHAAVRSDSHDNRSAETDAHLAPGAPSSPHGAT